MASVLESDVSHSSATATMERPHRAEDRREALAAARGWRGAEKDVEDAGDGLSAGALLVEGLAEQAGGAILRFGPPIACVKVDVRECERIREWRKSNPREGGGL